MSSYDIINRQNEPFMLKIQYAARYCYNSAEILDYFVWFFCLISAFSVFLPDELPWGISLGIPFTSDIVAVGLMVLVNKNVEKAADLRKYFDAYSMDIGISQYSDSEKRRLAEIACGKYSKNPKKAELQMKNSGKDSPPGVHDWYEFTKPLYGLEAKHECQRQNAWWDKKLFPIRSIITAIALGLAILGFIVLMTRNNLLETLLCSAGLLTKLVERICDNIRYRNLSIKIDGAQQAVEAHLSTEGIEKFQELIDKRRAVNVLGMNFLHKILAKDLTKRYSDISDSK